MGMHSEGLVAWLRCTLVSGTALVVILYVY